MRRVLPLVGALLAAAFLATGARAAPVFGFAEDHAKFDGDGGASVFATLGTLGAREVRVRVPWAPNDPTTIQDKAFLDRMIPVARRFGIQIVFSVYPDGASAITEDEDTRVSLFSAYLGTLARTYPSVTQFIVGNEPNEAFFWQPQYVGGAQASGAAYERLLAASYDVLKAVNPQIQVIGLAISPEANDVTSTSPVRFIAAVGAAYRASGRTAPLMDLVGLHLHPRVNTYGPERRIQWPNVGVSDLDRLKQAFWDAFNGTAQPTFAESVLVTSNIVRFKIAEIAWQTAIPPALASLYSGTETVQTVDEATQARDYSTAISILSCDPTVEAVLLFLLIDQPDLNRYQSGLIRADGSRRPAFDAVQAAIASAGSCASRASWQHTTSVLGASAKFDLRNRPAVAGIFGLSATAQENVLGKAGIFRVGRSLPTLDAIARALSGGGGLRPVLSVSKPIKANTLPRFEFRGQLKPGTYVYAVQLVAETDSARSSTFASAAFRVLSP